MILGSSFYDTVSSFKKENFYNYYLCIFLSEMCFCDSLANIFTESLDLRFAASPLSPPVLWLTERKGFQVLHLICHVSNRLLFKNDMKMCKWGRQRCYVGGEVTFSSQKLSITQAIRKELLFLVLFWQPR